MQILLADQQTRFRIGQTDDGAKLSSRALAADEPAKWLSIKKNEIYLQYNSSRDKNQQDSVDLI
jgi:hypothetical protein